MLYCMYYIVTGWKANVHITIIEVLYAAHVCVMKLPDDGNNT
jgi:hypothetical protein